MLSVTGWLLVINIAVFVIGGFMTRSGIPVSVAHEALNGADLDGALIEPQYRAIDGTPVSEEVVRRNAGNPVFRRLLDPETKQVVGREIYQIMAPLTAYGHFSTTKGFLRLEVWRLITFQFLHANLTHIFFNMLGLWIFGGIVEQFLGSRRYLAFYLMCGICGGLLYLLLNLIGQLGLPLPGRLEVGLSTPLVGASAGVFGVIIACAYIAPNTVVRLLFPPIPLKMRTFAYGYVLIAAANLIVFKGANQGGDAAHVGGALGGYFFIRRPHLLRDFFDVFGKSDSSGRGANRGGGGARRPSKSEAEVDRILDKVNTQGLHSLTESEKKTLRRASERRRE
ncbi:MAG: rhomboid family intramembrane serine protease [Phycisphaerales bacterium JB059]